jgi:hypothetical protein
MRGSEKTISILAASENAPDVQGDSGRRHLIALERAEDAIHAVAIADDATYGSRFDTADYIVARLRVAAPEALALRGDDRSVEVYRRAALTAPMPADLQGAVAWLLGGGR